VERTRVAGQYRVVTRALPIGAADQEEDDERDAAHEPMISKRRANRKPLI
jgi:hypothetical protein